MTAGGFLGVVVSSLAAAHVVLLLVAVHVVQPVVQPVGHLGVHLVVHLFVHLGRLLVDLSLYKSLANHQLLACSLERRTAMIAMLTVCCDAQKPVRADRVYLMMEHRTEQQTVFAFRRVPALEL